MGTTELEMDLVADMGVVVMCGLDVKGGGLLERGGLLEDGAVTVAMLGNPIGWLSQVVLGRNDSKLGVVASSKPGGGRRED